MSRKRHRSDTPADQDSFLDIVANLVGIMIILIVVVGSQIGESLVTRDQDYLQEERAQLAELESQDQELKQELAKRTHDHREWEKVVTRETQVASQRKMERDLVLKKLLQLKGTLAEQRNRLSEEQQQAYELRREIADLQAKTEDARHEIKAIQYQEVEEVSETDHEILEHYPTPIAKTVFGEEVHFQLQNDHVVYAPLNELVQRLRATWETHADEIPVGQSMIETIGPVGDFRLQYKLVCQRKPIPTANGTFTRTVVSLDQFELLPVRQGLGEPLEKALQEGSDFLSELRGYPPQRTTVSVWVYPDSYESFLELRKTLIQRGYKVAVWPLTNDQYISGSPDGLRSSAQ